MTQEIIFSDMINHYGLKLLEASEMLEATKSYLEKSQMIATDSWSSMSAAAFEEDIQIIKKQLSEIENTVFEMRTLIGAIDTETEESSF